MTLSEFAAQMLMKGRVDTSYVFYVHPDEIEAITREFAAIGNNLNQIAAFFNSGGIQSRAMLENINHAISCIFEMREQVAEMAGKNYGKSLMDLCNREFLYQVDLLSLSRTGVTEAEYWAQRRLDEKKQEIEKEGFTPNPTKFQTQKQLIRDAVTAAREKAISYEDFQDILQDEYKQAMWCTCHRM